MLFDAVLFDLDGTLVATDRHWVPAARVGARRAFAELGLEREPPSAAEWLSIVGQPFDEGLRTLFPDLEACERDRIGRACEAEQRRSLVSGAAAPMPGAMELLAGLRAAGLRIGVASNCGASYLGHMLGEVGLGEFIEEGRCLDSPGVSSKADMIADLLATFGTRSAVFVGDRESDRAAAWSNGLPHVHCRFGFAGTGEGVAAEATIEDLGALPGVLSARRSWIEAALEGAGCLRALATSARPLAMGVTGPPAAGKSLFARDAAAVFAAHGVPARALGLDDYREPSSGSTREAHADPLAGYDLARLESEILGPLERGELAVDGPDRGPVDVLLLEGPFLLDPRLRTRLERVLYLDVPEELSLRRASGRSWGGGGTESLDALHRRELPLQRALAEQYPPADHADLVLDASSPLGLDTLHHSG